MPAAAFKLKHWTPKEKAVQDSILELLERHPKVAVAIRYNCGVMWNLLPDGKRRPVKFNSAPGHSDIGGVLRGGRAFYFEIKRPGKKETDDQTNFLDKMDAAGALVACLHSVDECLAVLAQA